jgi:hypothetical protein
MDAYTAVQQVANDGRIVRRNCGEQEWLTLLIEAIGVCAALEECAHPIPILPS